MKVYISLPITGHNIIDRKQFAAKVADELRQHGHEPINPFDLAADGMTTGEILGKDVAAIIDQADAIVLCPGWMSSRGCVLELTCANLYGKSVGIYPSVDNFVKPGDGKAFSSLHHHPDASAWLQLTM